jgi:hypothetical protein
VPDATPRAIQNLWRQFGWAVVIRVQKYEDPPVIPALCGSRKEVAAKYNERIEREGIWSDGSRGF